MFKFSLRSALVLVLATSACTGDPAVELFSEPAVHDADDFTDSADLFDAELRSVSCDPLMHVFPVAAPHNIGYDNASCGTGTCAISCPDQNANSDWGGSHHGIDVFAYQGAPLVAVTDGQIVAVGTPSGTSGLRVRLRDACGWEYYYGHMDTAVVSTGQWVSAGQQLGTMGYTGTQSTHLHFNVSPDGAYSSDINPFDLLNSTSATACGGGPTGPGPVDRTCGWAPGNRTGHGGQSMKSCDRRFTLIMQTDGNLVLYQNGVSAALWHTNTHGNPGSTATMQGDGNLVVYSPGGVALWNSGTHGNPGAGLKVQDDGNLVIYSTGDAALWSSGSGGH